MTQATPDFPDWQQPVATAEVVKVFETNKSVDAQTLTGPYDTSQQQSLLLAVFWPHTGQAGDRFSATLRWSEPGGIGGVSESFTFHSVDSYNVNVGNGLVLSTPCRGSQVSIAIQGPATAVVQFALTGSSRPVPVSKLSLWGAQQERQRQFVGATPVAAGATSPTVYLPPCDTQLLFRANAVPNAADYRILAVYPLAPVPSASVLVDIGNTAQVSNTLIQAPRMGLEVQMINSYTASQNMGYVAWDVS